MKKISTLHDVRLLPESPARRRMEILLCDLDGDEEFNGSLGGDWYLFEEGDELFPEPIDWDCCEDASLEDGCYFIFWSTNNAGGPCLFVPDEPWVATEFT